MTVLAIAFLAALASTVPAEAGRIITEVIGEDGNTYICTTIISGEYGVDLGCVLKE